MEDQSDRRMVKSLRWAADAVLLLLWREDEDEAFGVYCSDLLQVDERATLYTSISSQARKIVAALQASRI